MARSATSSHARLIREMSKDSTGSSRSSRSNPSNQIQSTVSNFDPENEAIMSTKRIDDYAQRLPELRASAQKYSRFAKPSRIEPQLEEDYAIDTSAIGRAFPDFSQGPGSSEGSDMSIEIGRGLNDGNKAKTISNTHDDSLIAGVDQTYDDDSFDFSVPMIGNYEVTGTPPLNSKAAAKGNKAKNAQYASNGMQGRQPSGLRNETFGVSTHAAKSKDDGSSDSAKGKEHPRTLSAMHARVRDENDFSQIDGGRPSSVDPTVKSTRFNNYKPQKEQVSVGDLPNRFSATHGLLGSSASNKKNRSAVPHPQNPGTQQSFALPDMPNISELISGVYEDGTPVFSRHGKSRPTRFSSKAAKQPVFTGIDEVPVPEDEQAIFLSLKLLQDKVFLLEKNNAEAQTLIQDLQQKNSALETDRLSRRRVSHRSDSALGSTDSEGNEDVKGARISEIERNRLESSIRALQSQIDASNRKSSTAETILQSITNERDSAVSQLSKAYLTIEELKAENEHFRMMLRQMDDVETQTGRPNVRHGHVDGLAVPKQRNSHKNSSQEFSTRAARDMGRTETGTLFDLSTHNDLQKAVQSNQIDRSSQYSSDDNQQVAATTSKNYHQQHKVSSKAASSHARTQKDRTSSDVTFLSFTDEDEVAKLRRTLEKERLDRKQLQASRQQQTRNDTTVTYNEKRDTSRSIANTLPRKSSMKDVTIRTNQSMPSQKHDSSTKGEKETRRHSDTSLVSTHSKWRALNRENLTSAFIIPDITIRTTLHADQAVPQLSQENKAVLDSLSKHESQKCTVCQRKESGECSHDDGQRRSVKIPKPEPVSARLPVKEPYEEEATMRPSQAPGLALATVIKALEDEIAHLKIELSKYQSLYAGHDPALSKRKRKVVLEKMQALAGAIDVKSDQIYALYDVLEGQKKDGREMNQDEVEVTLQSIGVNTTGLHLRGGEGEGQASGQPKEKLTPRAPWELDSDDDSNDDLPWEGIESTIETTGRLSRALRNV